MSANGRRGVPRRTVLAAGALAGAALTAGGAAAAPDSIEDDLARYIGFGEKASGGPGDNAAGQWLEQEMTRAGFSCRRQSVDVPCFTSTDVSLTLGTQKAALIPQAIVQTTGIDGIAAPLRLATDASTDLAGAIALIVLPYRRWSTATDPKFREPVAAALKAGAAAVVAVSTGPTSEALAFNTPADKALFDKPVAILAPKDAADFVRAAERGETAKLVVAGNSSRRKGFNNIARLSRGAARTLVVSTPRSGWFTCGGERGPGIAVWLHLARWAAANLKNVDLEFLATAGHEYENVGGGDYLRALAPKPERVGLWLHLGANVAARDWHELAQLVPLPGADSQRLLMVSEPLMPTAQRLFAGQPGLERPYPAKQAASAGELTGILSAGYAPVAGVFGAHRFHHARADDARCVSAPLVRQAAAACAGLVSAALT